MSWSFDPTNAPASSPVFFVSCVADHALAAAALPRVVLERRALAVPLLGDADQLLALRARRRWRSPRRPRRRRIPITPAVCRPIGRTRLSLNRIAWPLRETRKMSSLPSVSCTSISSSPGFRLIAARPGPRRVVLGQRGLLHHALARREQQEPPVLVLLEVDHGLDASRRRRSRRRAGSPRTCRARSVATRGSRAPSPGRPCPSW